MTQKGYTLIEIIMVVTVLGILASIAVVSYASAQRRAYDAAITSDLTNFNNQFDIFRTRQGTADRYPNTLAELQAIGIKATRAAYQTENISLNLQICIALDAKSYVILARSKSGTTFAATKNGITTAAQPDIDTTTCGSQYSMANLSAGWSSSTWQSWVGS